MNVKGKDLFFYTLTGITLYMVYRMVNFGESLSEAASGFWEGLTFNPESLGPKAQLTEGAQLSQADWITRGFLEITPEGGTRITPAGEQYIRQQREKVINGQVVG